MSNFGGGIEDSGKFGHSSPVCPQLDFLKEFFIYGLFWQFMYEVGNVYNNFLAFFIFVCIILLVNVQ